MWFDLLRGLDKMTKNNLQVFARDRCRFSDVDIDGKNKQLLIEMIMNEEFPGWKQKFIDVTNP